MKLTQAYIRKLIMEELLNEQLQEAINTKDVKAFQETPQAQQPTSSQQTIAKTIEQNAQTSPFIKMMDAASSSQDQFFILQQFLQKIKIKDPVTFYKNLYDMALKLKDSKPQTANPAQPPAQPPVAKVKPQ